jgi:hypothetical protein
MGEEVLPHPRIELFSKKCRGTFPKKMNLAQFFHIHNFVLKATLSVQNLAALEAAATTELSSMTIGMQYFSPLIEKVGSHAIRKDVVGNGILRKSVKNALNFLITELKFPVSLQCECRILKKGLTDPVKLLPLTELGKSFDRSVFVIVHFYFWSTAGTAELKPIAECQIRCKVGNLFNPQKGFGQIKSPQLTIYVVPE